jgi:hypothetical protein
MARREWKTNPNLIRISKILPTFHNFHWLNWQYNESKKYFRSLALGKPSNENIASNTNGWSCKKEIERFHSCSKQLALGFRYCNVASSRKESIYPHILDSSWFAMLSSESLNDLNAPSSRSSIKHWLLIRSKLASRLLR